MGLLDYRHSPGGLEGNFLPEISGELNLPVMNSLLSRRTIGTVCQVLYGLESAQIKYLS